MLISFTRLLVKNVCEMLELWLRFVFAIRQHKTVSSLWEVYMFKMGNCENCALYMQVNACHCVKVNKRGKSMTKTSFLASITSTEKDCFLYKSIPLSNEIKLSMGKQKKKKKANSIFRTACVHVVLSIIIRSGIFTGLVHTKGRTKTTFEKSAWRWSMLDIFASTRPTRESKDIIGAPLFSLLRVPPTQQYHWFRAWLAILSERTGMPTAATARGRWHADALPRTVGLFTRTTTV